MTLEDRMLFKNLLINQRVSSLSVMVENKPYVSLLPFVFDENLCSIIVQASNLAKHSLGMSDNAPFTLLIHVPDSQGANPMELPRISLSGNIQRLEKDSDVFNEARDNYKAKFNAKNQYIDFVGFYLYQLKIEQIRFVAGFGHVYNIKQESIKSLLS